MLSHKNTINGNDNDDFWPSRFFVPKLEFMDTSAKVTNDIIFFLSLSLLENTFITK